MLAVAMQPEAKKYILAAAFTLALVFVAMFGAYSGMSRAIVGTDVRPAEQQQKTTQNTEEKAESASPASTTELQTETHAERSEALRTVSDFLSRFLDIKVTDTIIALFTIVLAIKTHGLFVETGALRAAATEQSRLLIKSIDETAKAASAAAEANLLARDIFIAENRPWTSVEMIPGENFHIDKDGKLYAGVNLLFKNHGRTPAVDITFDFTIVGQDSESVAEKQEEMSLRLRNHNKNSLPGGFSIFPDGTADEYRQYSFLPKAGPSTGKPEFDAHLNNFIQANFVGCVDYAFPLGGRGQTRFCYTLAKDAPSRMIIGGVGGAIQKTDEIIPKEIVILKAMIVGNSAE